MSSACKWEPNAAWLCRGCSPVLRLEASPLLATMFEPLGQIKLYLRLGWKSHRYLTESQQVSPKSALDHGRLIHTRLCTGRFQCEPSAQRGGVRLLQRWAHLKTLHRGTATRLAGQGERRQSCAGCRQLQASRRGGGVESTHPLAH